MLRLLLFLKRRIVPGFYINKNDLVIDIGSGDKPFWRADVFLDNLLLENNQRISNSKTIHDLGQYINGDVIKTAFKDRVFDFSFCSHLLEHVENPKLALREIMRISKRGYIEVPNGILESISPFPSHLWSIYNIDNQLVFVRKSKIMHDIHVKNEKRFRYIINKIHDPFIRLYWKNKISYKIINNLSNKESFVVGKMNKNNSGVTNINWYLVFIKIFRCMFYRNKKSKINNLLR